MKVDKDNYLFSAFATFAFTLILVAPLTLAYTATKPIADHYWQNQHYLKTIRALGIDAASLTPQEVEARYKGLKKYKISDETSNPIAIEPATDEEIAKSLAAATMGNMRTFLYHTTVGGEARYAGNFYGPGLWGNVALAIGINEDLSLLKGVEVLYQVETPGLGGRIGETWFTKQFQDLKSSPEIVFNLSGQDKENGMDAIAGATITSVTVKDIINKRALSILKGLKARLGGNS